VYELEVASDYTIDLGIRRTADGDLVERAAAGDGEAYAQLVRPHEHVAYRVAVAVAGADAQEAVQNAHLKAYRSLARFRPGAPFRPWLLRIVVNEAHNVRRSAQRHERLAERAAERHEPATASADEAVAAGEEVEAVLGALMRLSDADRLAIALRYFAELPDAEAAELAGTSTGAFRVRLLRARRRLEELLEEGHV
jgi:RNA polymerase sigma-70 factor (ECF subfamily)